MINHWRYSKGVTLHERSRGVCVPVCVHAPMKDRDAGDGFPDPHCECNYLVDTLLSSRSALSASRQRFPAPQSSRSSQRASRWERNYASDSHRVD